MILALFVLYLLQWIINGIIQVVESDSPPSPSPRGYPYEFDFRADYANKKRELDLKCNREYVLMPAHSKVVMHFVLLSIVSYSLCH